jgi:hypothetical protein
MPVRLKTMIGSFMLFIAGSLIYACGALGPSAEAPAHRHLGTNLFVRLEEVLLSQEDEPVGFSHR